MSPNDRDSPAAGALCFVILALLHIAVLALAGLSGPPPEAARKRVVTLTFSPPEAPPPAEAPQEPPQKAPAAPPRERSAAPLPRREPAPPAENPPERPGAEQSAEEATPPAGPETGEAAAEGVPAGTEAAEESPARRMTGAEYLALVMRRLEEKKVYPLAMRRRGIEGDAAVHFTIRPDGSLGEARSGGTPAHPFLVQAALETVRAAEPFPVMEGLTEDYALRVTIRFQLE